MESEKEWSLWIIQSKSLKILIREYLFIVALILISVEVEVD
jgi:hypothetical protein